MPYIVSSGVTAATIYLAHFGDALWRGAPGWVSLASCTFKLFHISENDVIASVDAQAIQDKPLFRFSLATLLNLQIRKASLEVKVKRHATSAAAGVTQHKHDVLCMHFNLKLEDHCGVLARLTSFTVCRSSPCVSTLRSARAATLTLTGQESLAWASMAMGSL